MNKPNNETEQLTTLIRQKYSELDDARIEAISPADLARAVFKIIDPKRVSPALVEVAAILELRQLARLVCRQRQHTEETKAEQENLFDFRLQPRYPAERDGDDAYVLREFLTIAERRENIARLRKEAEAKSAHADVLEAETEHLIRSGKLKEVRV